MGNHGLYSRIGVKREDWKRDWRLYQLNRQIANNARPKSGNPTVAFFLASTAAFIKALSPLLKAETESCIVISKLIFFWIAIGSY